MGSVDSLKRNRASTQKRSCFATRIYYPAPIINRHADGSTSCRKSSSLLVLTSWPFFTVIFLSHCRSQIQLKITSISSTWMNPEDSVCKQWVVGSSSEKDAVWPLPALSLLPLLILDNLGIFIILIFFPIRLPTPNDRHRTIYRLPPTHALSHIVMTIFSRLAGDLMRSELMTIICKPSNLSFQASLLYALKVILYINMPFWMKMSWSYLLPKNCSELGYSLCPSRHCSLEVVAFKKFGDLHIFRFLKERNQITEVWIPRGTITSLRTKCSSIHCYT